MQGTRKGRGAFWAAVFALVLAVASLFMVSGMIKPGVAFAASGQQMHRLYNPNSGEHFYTENTGERDILQQAGWDYEGNAWTAPATSSSPVYRLYSGTDHHYTLSAAERDMLVDSGWSYEGIGWYSDDAEGVPLYRQYNPNVDPSAPTNNSGSHNYTTNKAENDQLVNMGWIEEGIAWYGMQSSSGADAPAGPSGSTNDQLPVNPLSDFEHAVGDFVADRQVRSGSVADFKKTLSNLTEGYGGTFRYLTDASVNSSGRTAIGFDAGHGVYITGYKGTSKDIGVPASIGGLPVVYAGGLYVDYDSTYRIDVSRCASLKGLDAYRVSDVRFGTVDALRSVSIGDAYMARFLDMSRLRNLEDLEFDFMVPQDYSVNKTNLRCFFTECLPAKLDLSGAAKLETLVVNGGEGDDSHGLTNQTLNLSGCQALKHINVTGQRLTSFDVSAYPNLQTLRISSNLIKDTRALEAWASESGHYGEILPQR